MLPVALAVLLLTLSRFPCLGADSFLITDDSPTPVPGHFDLAAGEKMARQACSLCHLYPDPSLLPTRIWEHDVLPKMKYYLGIEQLDAEKTPEGRLLKASGLFPSVSMIPKTNWNYIEHFYLSSSPEKLPPQPSKPEIEVGLKGFVLDKPRFRRDPPLTTMVKIDPLSGAIFTADAQQQKLDILDPTGRLIGSRDIGNIAVDITQTERGFYLTCIGHFFPLEDRKGQLVLLERNENRFERKLLLSNLARPTDLKFADFNGDGKMDIVLCQFGFVTGRLSWFENKGDDKYEEHVLLNKPGAICSAVRDFDKDGRPDVAVLFGQDTDGLLIFFNKGNGEFKAPVDAFRKPPSYGHTHFELADFDGDGREDLLVTNGDNGDYESPPKPYHGIRVYLNEGVGKYKEKFFYPLHGAFKAVARDFDQDGDMDIAAISFFPDYENGPRESFVLLENLGDWKFKARTFRECIVGRWVTMDVGDLDGDGDLDIVLGSLIRMPSAVPQFLKDMWEKNGPSVVILRNTLKEPGASSINDIDPFNP